MRISYILISLCFLIYIPSSAAWGWSVHQALAEKAYDSLQIDMQNNLNLTLIKEGSIAPDQVFKNNRLHHYPPTYKLSREWFDKAREYYRNGDYKNSSYAFGALTHYISDSFVAPHYTSGEDYKLHSKFENQAKGYLFKTKCKKQSYELNKSLSDASMNQQDWEPWLNSEDPLIPQSEAEKAMELLYSVSLELFSTSCTNATKIEISYYKLSSKFMILSAIVGLIILLLLVDLFKD